MLEERRILLGGISTGAEPKPEYLELRYANRHGLVTGATGTGKTVTLQVLAEGFSEAGVPVFCADIKGDLSGLSERGEPKEVFAKRAAEIGLDPWYNDFYRRSSGTCRAQGSSGAHHRVGDGPALLLVALMA